MNIWMKWWNNKEDNDNKMKWWNVIKSMIMMKWMNDEYEWKWMIMNDKYDKDEMMKDDMK
jgi:hypothetical protein